MSPAQHPSGRPPAYLIGSQVASSNSTANQFLGASRKPWMTNTASTLLTRSDPKKLPSPSTKTRVTAKSPTRLPNAYGQRQTPAGSDSVVVRGSSIQAQACTPNNNSPSTGPQVVKQAAAPPTQVGPVSPSTPGATEPQSAVDPASDANPRSSRALTAGVKTSEPVDLVSTFPSPEPSNASLTSPVVAVAEEGHTPNGPPGKSASNTDATAHVASLPKSGYQMINGEGETAPLPARGSSNPSPNTQNPLKPPDPSLPQPEAASSRDLVWKVAREKLKSFLAMATRSNNLSDTVELPRVRILQDVCAIEDMFYLALHQIFCLNSFAPSHLELVSKYGIKPGFGFDVIAQLLVDNKRLSTDFVNWSIGYPLPLESMLKIEDYTLALTQVSNCLNMLTQNWSTLERDLRARGHPPQVDELVVRLGMVSPVFQTIAFTAFSRRLFGHREELFKACMALFEDDQRTYKQRCALDDEKKHQTMLDYFERYRQLCASYGVLREQPVRNVHRNDNAPAVGAVLSSNQPPTTTSLNTSAGPSQIRHPLLATSTHQPPLNPHPNIHHVDAYSLLPSNHPPNHTAPPNMAFNPGPQKQQPPYYQPPNQNFPSAKPSQTSQHYPRPSQPVASLPPKPPHHIITSQGNAPSQMPPPNNQYHHHHQYPSSHMRRGSIGMPVSRSIPGTSSNVNAIPAHPLPYPPPNPSFRMPQTPPHPGQSLQPPYSQPLPQPGIINTTPSMVMPMRPPKNHPQQSAPPIPPPSSTKPKDSPSMALLHFLPATVQQATPLPSPTRSAPVTEPSPEIIQYFASFAIPAQKLPSNRSAFSWQFTVSREILHRRPRLIQQGNGRGLIPVLSDGDVTYRLRCIRYEGQPDLNSMTAWSQAENHWPDVVYIHVNNNEIFRSPDSKNLPLAINSHLQEGFNHIRLNVLHTSKQRAKNITYAVAVEILHVNSPASFKSLIKTLSAHESRQQIQSRLSSSKNDDDDDLMIVDDFISIDLRDPFTTQVFTVPVRGLLCTHRECFDLPTFLQTLSAKPSAGKRALYLRCPICRQDARPELLIIDEFLVEVRAILSRQQKLETAKALRVKSDGSWEAVMEVESDTRTSTTRKRNRTSFEADLVKGEQGPAATPSRAPPVSEVIVLD